MVNFACEPKNQEANAGEDSGFTLARAWHQQGGEASALLEIDIKRGSHHDLSTEVGPYAALIRAALENKIHAIVGGPNCRSRSVLRHYKVPGQPNCPRPIRSWGGGEYGINGLSDTEKTMIEEDDILLWRMIFLAMVSNYINEARKDPRPVGFTLEQPASPKDYKPEVVSFWDTKEWSSLKKEFGWDETTFAQGQYGGSATKPTTFGGNLKLEVYPEDEEGKDEVQAKEGQEEAAGEKEEEEDPVDPPYLLPPPEKKEGEEDPKPGGFDIKIFRWMASTLEEYIQIEVMNSPGSSGNSRGIVLTCTPGDDPHANGRVEAAVKSFKPQIRWLLKQADVGSECWPLAARYADALNRSWRLGDAPSFPPFMQDVLVRRRTWRQGVFEPTVETVKIRQHGHWVQPGDEPPRVTKYVLRKAKEPITDQKWVAIEKEVADALTTRRRLREKTSVRKIEVEEKDSKNEEEAEREKSHQLKQRLGKMIEEEMKYMVEDDPDIAVEELKWVAKMKRMMEEPSEEDKILQTKKLEKLAGSHRCRSSKSFRRKGSFEKITRKELEEIQKKAAQEGRTVEIIPSKLVFTIKSGPNGGKRKTRWVICGNYESKKDSEKTFSSGADAAAFRLSIWAASRHQWAGAGDQEAILIVRPPALFTEKGYMAPQSLPTLCISKRFNSCSWCHPGQTAAECPTKWAKSEVKNAKELLA
ncbi:unnamed protein product [Cladocopium goreaui]|uniref:Copia protein n=1 Tax=Cladocopium goreaui TaxID=2562237 RepID=A0A9P1FW56_9DINO|nr:unnamed protein product [Cladocopium goreaui]